MNLILKRKLCSLIRKSIYLNDIPTLKLCLKNERDYESALFIKMSLFDTNSEQMRLNANDKIYKLLIDFYISNQSSYVYRSKLFHSLSLYRNISYYNENKLYHQVDDSIIEKMNYDNNSLIKHMIYSTYNNILVCKYENNSMYDIPQYYSNFISDIIKSNTPLCKLEPETILKMSLLSLLLYMKHSILETNSSGISALTLHFLNKSKINKFNYRYYYNFSIYNNDTSDKINTFIYSCLSQFVLLNSNLNIIYNILKNIKLIEDNKDNKDYLAFLCNFTNSIINMKILTYDNYCFNQHFNYLKITLVLLSYKEIGYNSIKTLLQNCVDIIIINLNPPVFSNYSITFYQKIVLLEKLVSLVYLNEGLFRIRIKKLDEVLKEIELLLQTKETYIINERLIKVKNILHIVDYHV